MQNGSGCGGAASPTTTTTTTSNRESSRSLCCLLTTSLVSLIFILSFSSSSSSSSDTTTTSTTLPSSSPFFFRHDRKQNYDDQIQSVVSNSNSEPPPPPPSIAYFICGSDGEGDRILRLLHSVYHPRNQYLLHLDLTASHSQRHHLALSVQSNPIFNSIQNVNVIGKPDFSNPLGSSAVSSTLHAAALLLRFSANWDWFINLSSSDYPLLTQDDLLHILSFLPKDLNFVSHSSYIGWRESRRMKPVIVDQGLFLLDNGNIFYATQKRKLPTAYRLFTGSSSTILSRKFVEFCILGSDNLPRTVLMYLSNTPSSQANYFQTVVCNSGDFNKTIVNHNMQWQWHSSWKSNSSSNSSSGSSSSSSDDLGEMIKSGAAFGTRFLPNDSVLDHVDREILKRRPGKIVPGGWCLGDDDDNNNDPCTFRGNADILRPGPGATRLERLIVQLLSSRTFRSNQCIFG